MHKPPIDFEEERKRLAKELGLAYTGQETEVVFWQEDKQTEEARAALLAEMQKRRQAGAASPDEAPKTASNPAAAPEQAFPHADGEPAQPIFESGPADAGHEPDAAAVTAARAAPVPFWLRVKVGLGKLAAFFKNRRERSQAGNIASQEEVRKRQRRNMVLCLAGLVFFTIAAVYFGGGAVTRAPDPVRVYQSDFRIEPDALDKQSYQQRYDEKLADMAARLKTMEELAARLERDLADKREGNGAGGKDAPAAAVPVAELPPFTAAQNASEAAALNAAAASGGPALTGPRLARIAVSDPVAEMKTIEKEARRRLTARRLGDAPIASNRARHEAAGAYLPAGSFARAVVLAGATVSTGGTSASNPVPMLLEVKDLARLPNAFRANVKACFVTANATGDLSSERIWIRLERLSCMTQSGKAFDARIQGYVTGDDGKTGVRARLVTRSGQAIASALLTGSISGLGKAVSLSAQNSTTFTSGAVGTTVTDSFRAGLGEGLENALDRIADYYIRLADKIFPCLEIDSGRRVDLILSQGLTVEVGEEETGGASGGTPAPMPAVNSSELFGDEMQLQQSRYE